MTSANWTALLRAAIDVCRANCRQHRERATRSLQAAINQLDAPGDPRLREDLLCRLARYAAEFPEDPEAQPLISAARELGILL